MQDPVPFLPITAPYGTEQPLYTALGVSVMPPWPQLWIVPPPVPPQPEQVLLALAPRLPLLPLEPEQLPWTLMLEALEKRLHLIEGGFALLDARIVDNITRLDEGVAGNITRLDTGIAEGTRRLDKGIAGGVERFDTSIEKGAARLDAGIAQGVRRLGASIADNIVRLEAGIANSVRRLGAGVADNIARLDAGTAPAANQPPAPSASHSTAPLTAGKKTRRAFLRDLHAEGFKAGGPGQPSWEEVAAAAKEECRPGTKGLGKRQLQREWDKLEKLGWPAPQPE
jgi:hypothetical protein